MTRLPRLPDSTTIAVRLDLLFLLNCATTNVLADDSWPDLLQVLFQLSQAPDAGKRETAFRVFTTTPGIIERQHEEQVAGVFAQAFKDESVSV